jgi:hypothetical protein
MDPIAVIREKLAAFPEVRISEVPDGIRIEAPNEGGFAVTVEWDSDEWTVYAGDAGMHSHRSDPQSVVEYLWFLLSEDCALREFYRGDQLIGATIRPVEEHERGEVVGFFAKFWRRP